MPIHLKSILIAVLIFIAKVLVIVSLPFILLIRSATFLYSNYGWATWPALFVSILLCSMILFIYLFYVRSSLYPSRTATTGYLKIKGITIITVVAIYCTYTLLYISHANTKDPAVRREFRSLHPYLRLGLGTIIFLDEKLLITDAARMPEDYKKMGLQSKKQSLHYKQKDGYIHAVDLRTRGRSGIRNFLLKSYFQLMGFNALRHYGAGDHLHVSLSVHHRPGAV